MKQNYNNESLALLGHGKWKSALGHTLLLIGMVLVSLGAYAQQLTPVPDGLKMEKKWVSDDPTGRTGNIYVETFVTGHSVSQHVPTDIVLVLDVSGSMDEHLYDPVETPGNGWTYNNYGSSQYYYRYVDNNEQVTFCLVTRYYSNYYSRYYLRYTLNGTQYNLGNSNSQNGVIYTGVLYEQQEMTKMDALQTSVGLFVDIIANDATQYNVDHRISIVKYGIPDYYGSESSLAEGNHTTNTYTYNGNTYSGTFNYTEVVVNRKDPRTNATSIKNSVNDLVPGGATAADRGMSKARYLLASIPASEFEERNKVVVMFTDGSPTYTSGFQTAVATNTISYAHELKNSWTYNNNTYDFNATVFSVGVFDVETDNIYTYMNRVSSNYPDATGMGNNQGGTQASNEYYFKAESAGGLSEIFESIAGASGAMTLPSSAIVQDMVSPNFQLPAGATGTVTAYAPLCTDYDEETGEYTFEDINDAATLTIGQVPDPDHPGQYITGVVTSTDGANENKLPANFVTVTGKTIKMSGFNFSYHWCGTMEDPVTHENKIHGRKIVIKIPVEVQGGTWGDGIETNDPAHSYIQVGDTYYGPFNNLTTNVLGDVWTEIVTSKPANYNNMDIDTPEELAWFISEVNGRIHYNGNTNNVASNTTLNGRLTADIDMSAHNWVPIGAGYKCNANNEFVLDANGKKIKLAYEGEFDGNGHVITGLKNNADKWYKTASGQENEVVVYPGMFSNVKGTVHDVFILDSDFRGKAHQVDGKGKFIHHGILADTLTGGTIYNCEAAGRMTCNNDNGNDVNLIYGGLVGLVRDNGTIYNSMAMAELKGYTMGGAVGEIRSGSSFRNGFTNGVYKYLGADNTYKVGGIAAINDGNIDNTYVRFERLTNENLDKATFGMLVGDGTAPTNSYIPQIVTWSRPSSTSMTTLVDLNASVPNTVTTPAGNPTNSYTLSVNKTYYNMFTNDNMTGGTWGTLGSFNVYQGGTPLVDKLEENKGTNGASWKRTTAGTYSTGAGNINGDFPVLQLDGYTCLASTDGISIDYAHNLSDMLHRHNSGALNEKTTLGNSYKVTDHAAINGGSINLFVNEDMNPSNSNSGAKADLDASYYNTDANVVVYIDENISLLQPTDATSTPSSIEAYTGQTLQAFDNTELQEGDRWHNISSSLSNSQFGWHYNNNEQVTHNFESDPCGWNLNSFDEDYAFFPVDLRSYHRAEFYCFFEPEYHWINFRRNGQSHWHMDNYTTKIQYEYTLNGVTHELENEEQFIPGKGYLAAVDMSTYWSGYNRTEQFLQNRGTLNNGAVDIPVTYTTDAIIDLDGYHTSFEGYNLLGNPYQSFLDFSKFISGNSGLWTNSKYAETCAIYDPSEGAYLQIPSATPSEGAKVAGPTINMHQGFFIQVGETGTAHFTNDMRTNDAEPNFRGSRPTYPLINFTVTDREGNNDVAVLELNRPENDGAKKLRTGNSVGRIYFRYDNTNMAIFFRDNAEGHQTLNFAAEEDGNFTLNWNTANADFRSLTLVDNITGIKTDMLTHDHYTFEGRVDDYNTRFKIVFGEMDNNEEEPVLEHFAFFDQGNLIVNGTGHFEVVDVLGRVVYATELTDTQNTVSLPSNVRGVCMLCFTRNNETKVQKMVIQ